MACVCGCWVKSWGDWQQYDIMAPGCLFCAVRVCACVCVCVCVCVRPSLRRPKCNKPLVDANRVTRRHSQCNSKGKERKRTIDATVSVVCGCDICCGRVSCGTNAPERPVLACQRLNRISQPLELQPRQILGRSVRHGVVPVTSTASLGRCRVLLPSTKTRGGFFLMLSLAPTPCSRE